MRAIGVPSQAWIGWLIKHERYHKSKGEVLPDEWTVRGLKQEFKDKVLSPRPRIAKPLDAEAQAIAAFNRLAGKGNQSNGRTQPPVMRPLDTRAFGSFK
jgi:hypothetical protein